MMRTVHVELGERSYPIYIDSGLLPKAAAYLIKHGLSMKSPHLIVTDDKVAPYHLETLRTSLKQAGLKTVVSIVKSGEGSKSLQVFEEVMTSAIQGGLDRSSSVIALGGGVVGDLAGFVAATYMRGIAFIQMPTTILAHDSSVGGKVAVNHPLAKNMIGAFHQPELVLYDLDTLKTLPPREVSAGLAEMVKHGLIKDQAFAYWCKEHAAELLALDQDALGYGLQRGVSIKAEVVSQDEREGGLRAILNLGHTIGHAIEAVAGYGEFLHGEAISIGMAGSALLAEALSRGEGLHAETTAMLKALNLPVVLPDHLKEDDLMAAMKHDKKFKEGTMIFVVPDSIGSVSIVKDIPEQLVRDILKQLRKGGEAHV